jgi:Family of unknown function (DUF5522)
VTERELIEGIDYYVENGLMVLTAQYLRDRGYCCTSGCRHCPYGFEREDAAHVTAPSKIDSK